ncbi:hypothetical protein E4T56_gene5649 [Termitomyces sp. T112]|nr:hypothetical protein E4T56_gene5649 [Termitomyces sp. T112]
MSILIYFLIALSSIFRLAVHIFLRVIPTRLVKSVLPLLYSADLLSSIPFVPRPRDNVQSQKVKQVKPASQS